MATFRVTVQEAITSVGVTTDVTVLSEQVVGVQGPTGLTGATGATGAQGSSGVVSVTSPITNAGTSSAAIVGIDQSLLAIARTQVTGTAAVLNTANAFTVGGHTIVSEAAGVIPATLVGASGQTADLLSIRVAAGTALSGFDALGKLYVRTGSNPSSASLHVGTANPTVVPIVSRGAASQTANLQEWQNSAGTVVAFVSAAGNFRGNLLQTVGAGFDAREGSGGGGLATFIKTTAAPTNPGTNVARLYFRDGTNAGTLKLVVRAGTAGAETTILDNIPQT